jgi:hypothetical protein
MSIFVYVWVFWSAEMATYVDTLPMSGSNDFLNHLIKVFLF